MATNNVLESFEVILNCINCRKFKGYNIAKKNKNEKVLDDLDPIFVVRLFYSFYLHLVFTHILVWQFKSEVKVQEFYAKFFFLKEKLLCQINKQ